MRAAADEVVADLQALDEAAEQRQDDLTDAHACSPPTARPGTSNHEDGLAIDFSCADGRPMTHASPCYRWLAANAGRYHRYNLPSEPWHWSVTGR